MRADDLACDRWQLTSLPSGAYSITSMARTTVNCGNYLLSCAACGGGNFVDLYNFDDASGRQVGASGLSHHHAAAATAAAMHGKCRYSPCQTASSLLQPRSCMTYKQAPEVSILILMCPLCGSNGPCSVPLVA